MQMEHNKAVVRAFVEAINAQDWERIDALVSADFTRHSDAAGGDSHGGQLGQALRWRAR